MKPSEIQLLRLSRIAVEIKELEDFSAALKNAHIANQDIIAQIKFKEEEYNMENQLFCVLCEMEMRLKGGMTL